MAVECTGRNVEVTPVSQGARAKSARSGWNATWAGRPRSAWCSRTRSTDSAPRSSRSTGGAGGRRRRRRRTPARRWRAAFEKIDAQAKRDSEKRRDKKHRGWTRFLPKGWRSQPLAVAAAAAARGNDGNGSSASRPHAAARGQADGRRRGGPARSNRRERKCSCSATPRATASRCSTGAATETWASSCRNADPDEPEPGRGRRSGDPGSPARGSSSTRASSSSACRARAATPSSRSSPRASRRAGAVPDADELARPAAQARARWLHRASAAASRSRTAASTRSTGEVVAFATTERPVEFGAADGVPVDLIFLVASPTHAAAAPPPGRGPGLRACCRQERPRPELFAARARPEELAAVLGATRERPRGGVPA